MQTFDQPRRLLTEVMATHSKWKASKPALICGERQLTWG